MKKILSLSLILLTALQAQGQGAVPVPMPAQPREQAVPMQDTIVETREVFIIEDNYHNPYRQLDNEQHPHFYVTMKEKEGSKNTRHRKDYKKTKPWWEDGHWTGMSLTYNGLITSLDDLSLPEEGEFLGQSPKSIGVSLQFGYSFWFSRRTGFVTGLGFEFNNFRFSDNIGLTRVDGVTVPDHSYEDRGIRLEKSKLNTSYLNIPLLFEVQIGRRHKWFINGGVIGGVLLGSHTKIKARDAQLKGKYKNHGNLGIRNFHYGFTVNAGFNNVAFTATYYPSSIFRSGEGPQVQQANIGLVFLIND